MVQLSKHSQRLTFPYVLIWSNYIKQKTKKLNFYLKGKYKSPKKNYHQEAKMPNHGKPKYFKVQTLIKFS